MNDRNLTVAVSSEKLWMLRLFYVAFDCFSIDLAN
jgi:hypothetical protein